MATLSDLPNELLIEIWCHVLQPEDIERFALASKKIHGLSGPFLLEHRILKHRFSIFRNRGRKSKRSAAGLLKEITMNPRVALYVEGFAITSRDCWENEEEGVNTLMAFDPEAGEDGYDYRHTPYAEKDMILLEQAVKRAGHIFGNVESLIDGIRGGHEGPIIALLLLLLTNLESLVVEKMEDDSHFLQTLQYISNTRNIEALRRLIEGARPRGFG